MFSAMSILKQAVGHCFLCVQAYKEQVAGLQSQLAIEAHRFTQTKTAADELLVQLQGQQSYVMELAMINKAMQVCTLQCSLL